MKEQKVEIKREAASFDRQTAPRYQTKLNEKSFYRFDTSLFRLVRLFHLEVPVISQPKVPI